MEYLLFSFLFTMFLTAFIVGSLSFLSVFAVWSADADTILTRFFISSGCFLVSVLSVCYITWFMKIVLRVI